LSNMKILLQYVILTDNFFLIFSEISRVSMPDRIEKNQSVIIDSNIDSSMVKGKLMNRVTITSEEKGEETTSIDANPKLRDKIEILDKIDNETCAPTSSITSTSSATLRPTAEATTTATATATSTSESATRTPITQPTSSTSTFIPTAETNPPTTTPTTGRPAPIPTPTLRVTSAPKFPQPISNTTILCGSDPVTAIPCLNGGKCLAIYRPNAPIEEYHCDCQTANLDGIQRSGKYCEYEATVVCRINNDTIIDGDRTSLGSDIHTSDIVPDQNGISFCVNGGTCKSESYVLFLFI
jgi:hypothetical protein